MNKQTREKLNYILLIVMSGVTTYFLVTLMLNQNFDRCSTYDYETDYLDVGTKALLIMLVMGGFILTIFLVAIFSGRHSNQVEEKTEDIEKEEEKV